MTGRPPAEPTALVTGAAQGIGKAVAASLLEAGMRVAMLDLDGDAAAAAAGSLCPDSSRTLALVADVGRPEEIDEALDQMRDHWGPADVLVNSAGRTVSSSIWDIEVEDWDQVLATNLRSQLIFCQRCAPAMREARWGRIVNMASMAGQQGGTVAGAHYAASKAGIIVLTKILARELAGFGVTANAVAPAAIRTPAMDAVDQGRIDALEHTIPVGRVGQPEEVAALVAYLCSPEAGFVTGATMDINGGMSMR